MRTEKAQHLVNIVMNERGEHDLTVSLVNHLRIMIDRTAEKAAKANAEWHDDPEAEDHADYHAPAAEQFTREERDAAIVDLVTHYLTEARLSDAAKR